MTRSTDSWPLWSVWTWSTVGWCLALAGAVLLVAAGIEHTRQPSVLRSSMEAQRTFRASAVPLIARVLGPIELIIGVGVLGCWVVGSELIRPLSAAAAVLYAAFAVYTLFLLRRRPTAPCGCFGTSDPVTVATVARAAFLAVILGLAAARWGHVLDDIGITVRANAALGLYSVSARWSILTLGTLIACLLWILPLLADLRQTNVTPPPPRPGQEPERSR